MCQFLKRNKKQYGKLPPKEADTNLWFTLCEDLIGKTNLSQKEEKRNSKSCQKEMKRNIK